MLHTDGTVFTIDNGAVVGIDPKTGSQKFQIQTEENTSSISGTQYLGDAFSLAQGVNSIVGVSSPSPGAAFFCPSHDCRGWLFVRSLRVYPNCGQWLKSVVQGYF